MYLKKKKTLIFKSHRITIKLLHLLFWLFLPRPTKKSLAMIMVVRATDFKWNEKTRVHLLGALTVGKTVRSELCSSFLHSIACYCFLSLSIDHPTRRGRPEQIQQYPRMNDGRAQLTPQTWRKQDTLSTGGPASVNLHPLASLAHTASDRSVRTLQSAGHLKNKHR